PPRYLYGYPTARDWTKNIVIRILSNIANHFLRIADFNSAQNADFFVANSKNVAERVKKFYRLDAVVIYPPVDVSTKYQIPSTKQSQNSKFKIQDSNYFLTGGRLARPKRIDLAIRACTKLKLPLKVFGKEFAGYGDELKGMAGPTVQFLGEISEEEKYDLMRGAKAFIFPAEEEDFGITPVEAMMVGAPVIAARSGGVVESVVSGKTGVFFDEQNVDSLVSAIKKFEEKKWNRAQIAKYAQKFSKERFKREIRDFVQSHVK
ncbi:glycosyltransferase, partial [Candidatus Microgenomates bacterium]|nr:glycosyltransferase [Candidatus Microgenomates bacterium]